MESNITWSLVELQKKIDQIEDKDSNYINNPKWKKYRKQQDLLYKKIRKSNEQERER